MFIENMQNLKEKEMMQAQSSQLESIAAEACRIVLELHILEDAQQEVKIIKLATSVSEAKAELGRVQFEFNMKITNIQLNL